VFVEFIMKSPKGTFERKHWKVVGTKEMVRADGSRGLTVRIRRTRKSEAMRLKREELLAEQAQQSRKEERRRKKFLALAKEAHSLDPEAPPATKPVRAVKIEKVGALSEEMVGKRDFGTDLLTRMLAPKVLREDDMLLRSHAPLNGRNGRARVNTDMERLMFAPGIWPNHQHVFKPKDGMHSGPSKRMETSSSEASGEEASDSEEGAVDTWVQCEDPRCSKWRNFGGGSVPEGTFFCSGVPGHTCATLEEPYEAD
jgi:hypothetical protein